MIESIYSCITIFVIFYPIVTSVMWIVFSITYKIRWEEMHHEVFPKHLPKVSIIIPAYNEEKLIASGLKSICGIKYPDYEIVVINDGSKDATLDKIIPFLKDPKIRVLDKKVNQGKALGLNDALLALNGDIIVVMDADAEPEPDVLHHLTWHFQHPRVGAVTGHPRVRNTNRLLSRIQVIEFTSIIGLLRRSQRIWGRIVTVSGIIAAFRKEAIYDVGGFSPNMYTEDIDISWRLEKRHWDIRYEPRAIVWMHVPDTLKDFFKQRLRWARGLMEVLRVHKDVITTWKSRRMWPMFIESSLSTLWNTLYGLVLVIEFVEAFFFGTKDFFAINAQWMMLLATFSLFQLLIGGILEVKHDKDIFRFFPYAILYPIFYWIFMTIVTWIAFPSLWRDKSKAVKWSSTRR